MTAARSEGRKRGQIEERGDSLRVVYYAGLNPVTGKRSYLRETIKGTDKAAYKKAENKLAEFRTQVAKQQSTTSTVPFGHAIDEWMKTTEIEDGTHSGYVNYIERYIRPTTTASRLGASHTNANPSAHPPSAKSTRSSAEPSPQQSAGTGSTATPPT